jgi:GNAT superfamily N-acetyltransferase
MGDRDMVADGYPMEVECNVVTGAGSPLTLRPIRPDDSTGLTNFHQLLTPTSVYRRYFYFHPYLSQSEIDHLTHVDYVDRMAVVVEDDGTLIAVGRYDRRPGTTEAEVAFVVADAYQHLGLGTLLLGKLVVLARQSGISTLQASVLADNGEMLGVFRHSGLPLTTAFDGGGVVSVRMSILVPVEQSPLTLMARGELPEPP